MFKQILVALDGSDTANLALDEAITLAKEGASIVRGVYVIDAYSFAPQLEFISLQEVVASIREEAAGVLDQAKKKLDAAGVRSETKIVETEVSGERIAQAIAKEAKNWPADLIVVGTHGRRGFSHFLLGSVAESIVRVATKPVLLIRGKES